ncbi:MAG: multiheme c-type cytochrome [Isosphaeraceae bacterium]
MRGPVSQHFRTTVWSIVAVMAASLLLALFWRLASREEDAFAVLDPVAEATRPGALFAGSRACRECHPGEYAAYTGSGHAHTLAPASKSAVARLLDGQSVEDPEYPGVTWSYALRGDQFAAERTERDEVQRFILDYALGSGRHAGTFVTLTDPVAPVGLEHRLTYYAADGAMAVTPGQRHDDDLPGVTPRGRALSTRDTLRCFGCHATPADGVLRTAAGKAPLAEPGRLIPNVSCERCHGPGLAHVNAARTGRGTLTMRFGIGPAAATSAAQLGLCGQCHRHPARFPRDKIRPDDPSLARFQPIGLSQSSCYLKSEGALSCTTCHDPHFRASTDPAGYDRACLNCHQGPDQTSCGAGESENCARCHMPKVDSGQRVMFTDHWIRTR